MTQEGQPKKASVYVRDAIFFAGGRVFASTSGGKGILSLDSGATWSTRDTVAPLEDLALGIGGRVWGIYGWPGIHEPDSMAICYSDDQGESWQCVTSDSPPFIPVAIISPAGSEPVVLAFDGQLWAHRKSERETLDSWTKCGKKVPDEHGKWGGMRGKHVYVSSATQLWYSPDAGNSWSKMSVGGGALSVTERECWAFEHDGTVSTSALGENKWIAVRRIEKLQVPGRITVAGGAVYLAAEVGGPDRGIGGLLDSAGVLHEYPGITTEHAHLIRVDPAGRPWLLAGGLYRLGKSERWEKCWPMAY